MSIDRVNQLIPSEVAVLRALEDQRAKARTTIAKETDLPAWTVHSILRNLARRQLVRRGQTLSDAGRWSITLHGLEHANRLRQMRLV